MNPSPSVQPQQSLLKAVSKKVVPIKVGWFGPQGSGKTTSAALLALALSKEIYGGAPVFVTDTEPGWQFLKPLFKLEGVDLIQRTDPTFKAMTANLREAERLGACVWNVDTLTIIWNELMQSFKGKKGFIPIDKWGDIREMWNRDYVGMFINTAMCCQALGRLGNITEEIRDAENSDKTKLVKTGERFKAGGSEDFGYEPHLLLQVSNERKAKVVHGDKREGEGRIIHRVDVLKDRTWVLNGKVFRFSDMSGFRKGAYQKVWEAIQPHFDALQETAHVQIETQTSSASLIAPDGTSAYYRRQQRQQVALDEIKETSNVIFSGQTEHAKSMRLMIMETLFNSRSWTYVQNLEVETLEIAQRALERFEDSTKRRAELLTDKVQARAELERLQTEILESGTEPILEFEHAD